MKTRLFAVFVLVLIAASAFAEPPVRKTVVIRDGQMFVDGEALPLNEELFGGKRAWLGVSLMDLTPELREHYGASKNAGIVISSVAPDSPAARAGLRVGDVVVSVDGGEVRSSSALRKALRQKKEGDAVRIELLRGRARQTVVATVVEREGLRVMAPEIREITTRLNSPEWRARLERIGPDCEQLQTRIRDLETRLKDLEKKLEK